jgi:hypothetical protein
LLDQSKAGLERPLIRMGAVAFILGIVVFAGSSMFHASREDPTDHPRVFAEYAESDTWTAAHVGQFAGGMLIMGGYVGLFQLLSKKSQSGIVSALAWLGLVAAILTSSTLAILQAVDGVALKMAVDSWAAAPADEKMAAFRVAEGIRWTEIGINSYFTMLQGATGIIFSLAMIIKKTPVPRWVGGIGMLGAITTMIAGVFVGYVGFASTLGSFAMVAIVSYYLWMIITGIYMWQKSAMHDL